MENKTDMQQPRELSELEILALDGTFEGRLVEYDNNPYGFTLELVKATGRKILREELNAVLRTIDYNYLDGIRVNPFGMVIESSWISGSHTETSLGNMHDYEVADEISSYEYYSFKSHRFKDITGLDRALNMYWKIENIESRKYRGYVEKLRHEKSKEIAELRNNAIKIVSRFPEMLKYL